ncbi:DotU family type IV/VI secretion system protein [Tundrisphaera sp. TA3]|uniref:DotU family type IV/VI secretion system protein n=1 Tax=Tundrisphaera sp. TA3 TaxID=3435775 RepID=UPI003EB7F56A
MTESFANLVFPVIRRLVDFRARVEAGENPPLEAERAAILADLDEADGKSRSSTQLAHDFALARCALVYWIDEVMLTSRWAHAGEWKERILEFEIYGKWEGGELFYEKAHEAERLAGTDPLEVFFLCAALGFQGRYAFDHPAYLAWVDRVYQRIAAGSPFPDRFLPDDAVPREPLAPLPGQSILLAVSILVSATVLATLAGLIVAVHTSL